MVSHPDVKLYVKNDMKSTWTKNEIFDKKPIVVIFICTKILYFLVHDVKELLEGHDSL